MKIERIEPLKETFRPIKITIETKEELFFMKGVFSRLSQEDKAIAEELELFKEDEIHRFMRFMQLIHIELEDLH